MDKESRSGGNRGVIATNYVKKSHAGGTCDAATAAKYAVDVLEVGEMGCVLPAMREDDGVGGKD